MKLRADTVGKWFDKAWWALGWAVVVLMAAIGVGNLLVGDPTRGTAYLAFVLGLLAALRLRELRTRTSTLEAFSAHRREQVSQLATVIEGLQATERALVRRVEQLEAEQHGHCRGCGAVTDFPTIDSCRKPSCVGAA